MNTFEQWVRDNAPHVWEHRDGPLSSTYASYSRCWDAAVRSIGTTKASVYWKGMPIPDRPPQTDRREDQMSDTPRTDKHVADIAADGLVDGDFARALERECARLAANQCHDGYGDEHGHHCCREVDKWRALSRDQGRTLAELRAEQSKHVPPPGESWPDPVCGTCGFSEHTAECPARGIRGHRADGWMK